MTKFRRKGTNVFFVDDTLMLHVPYLSDRRKNFAVSRDTAWLMAHFGADFAEMTFCAPLNADFEVYRMYENVFLSGRLQTALSVACACCLKE
ncbi:MAG: hypothetical protein D6795_08140, partial [Deltaproteobacteria bacterium]